MKGKESSYNFIITEKAWNIMQQYAGIAYEKDKNEISGITCVKKVKHPVSGEMVWELFEPIILTQENTGTTTELDGDALRDFYIKAGMKYGKDIRFCWWHSRYWSRDRNTWTNDNENI